MIRQFSFVFLFFLSFSLYADSDISRNQAIFQTFKTRTEEHKRYLSRIGLGERAKGISVSYFVNEVNSHSINLSHFKKRTQIPECVTTFDPKVKNTIITTDPDTQHNKEEDVRELLDIRLYPPLRDFIKKHRVEVFLGGKLDMIAYYKSVGSTLFLKVNVPSTVTYYLAESSTGKLFAIMTGLVSEENLIAQLLTLKIAEIDLNSLEIIGEVDFFRNCVTNDFINLFRDNPKILRGNNILIVAGCGLEKTVSEMIEENLFDMTEISYKFKGDILSLTYYPFTTTINGFNGVIILNQNYGEIIQTEVAMLLENCHCTRVFSGGAGGYISSSLQMEKPNIGDRVEIITCIHHNGEKVTLRSKKDDFAKSNKVHLHVPSIFLETYDWLNQSKKIGNSVDVETFYIVKAIHNFQKKNPELEIEADCGFFISDFVGEKPLREYSNVYVNYPQVLRGYLKNTLNIKEK